jgi:hypothetical protein
MIDKCSVCSCDFSLDEEGGIEGNFGILPVQFCPTCLSCMIDMVNQITGDDDESLDTLE